MNTDGLILVGDKVYKEVKAYKNKQGYTTVWHNNKSLRLHRLKYILAHGEIDDEMTVDHINNNKDDNRLANLQLLTRIENGTKRRVSKGYHKNHNRWRVIIWKDHVKHNIGTYGTECAARLAYLMAKFQISLS